MNNIQKTGIFLGLCIAILGLGSIAALFLAAEHSGLWFDDTILHTVQFSLLQALLSAGLSVVAATALALSIWHCCRWQWFVRYVLPIFLHGSSLMIVIPTTIAAHGVLMVWGRSGLYMPIREALEIPLFGLSGILLGHVLLNLPLSFRIITPGLLNLPIGLQRQALLLNFSGIQWWQILAFPAIKPLLLGAFGLVFLLCFTSFALVLMLGGGPAAATLEVAIYEAVRFELDFARAGTLSLIQLLLCGVFLLIIRHPVSWIGRSNTPPCLPYPKRLGISLLAVLIIVITLAFLLPPLLVIIERGAGLAFFDWLQKPIFYQSLGFSVGLAFCSATGNILCSLLLIQAMQHSKTAHTLLHLSGNLFLFIPTVVFGTGLFLLLRHVDYPPLTAPVIVLLANVLFTLPFSLRLLAPPMLHHAKVWNRQYTALGLLGFRRLWWGDWRAHKRELTFAASLSAAFSLGDFGVIALFHNDGFTTLPWLLYSVQGRYQAEPAAALALWLLLLVLGMFVLGNRYARD